MDDNGYPHDWSKRRRKVLQRDKYRCQFCLLRSTRSDQFTLDIDHIIPKSRGGSHMISNLRALCKKCHAERHPRNRALNLRRYMKPQNWPSKLLIYNAKRIQRLFDASSRGTRLYVDPDGRQIDIYPYKSVFELEEDKCISLKAKVVDLWDLDEPKIFQSGLLVDPDDSESEPVKFVSWADNDLRRLHEHETYLFIGAKTSRYNGKPQISCDARTAIKVASRLDL